MFPMMCSQPPCMNIEVSAVTVPALADGAPGGHESFDLAGLVGELDEPSRSRSGQLVEDPDGDVRDDQRDGHERERPGRDVVLEREHALRTISAISAFWAWSRFSAWSQTADCGP